MIDHLLTQTATIVRRTQTSADADGVPVTTQTTTTAPCLLQRSEQVRGSGEVQVPTESAVSEWLLFLGPTVAIDVNDEVEVDSVRYQVFGEPAVQRTPQGPHHIEARLRKVA